jgi:hypothetical protein
MTDYDKESTTLKLKCSVDPETDFLNCFRCNDGEVKKVNIVVYNQVYQVYKGDQGLSRQAAIVLSLEDAEKLKNKLEELLS